MNEPITLRINEIVGDEICVSTGDGQKVFEQIATALQNKKKVDLSFLNVETLTSAFLNAAIGQLYGKFSEDQIDSALKVSDITPEDQILLDRVKENAKAYFKDPNYYRKALREVMENEDDS